MSQLTVICVGKQLSGLWCGINLARMFKAALVSDCLGSDVIQIYDEVLPHFFKSPQSYQTDPLFHPRTRAVTLQTFTIKYATSYPCDRSLYIGLG